MSKRLQLGASAVVAFAILAGVYTPRLLRYRELSDARERWTVCGIDDYRWTIDIGGFLLGGRIHLDVRDARAVHADDDTVLPPRGTYPRTVEELFDDVGRAAGSDPSTSRTTPSVDIPRGSPSTRPGSRRTTSTESP